MEIKEFAIQTRDRTEFIDITAKVQKIIRESKVKNGTCFVYVPHTTAGVTINENADPDVISDILSELNRLIPFDSRYAHAEGNSAAHIKSSLTGNSKMLFIENGNIKFGTWQGIFFCEFDGPRNRQVWVKILPDCPPYENGRDTRSG